VLESGGGIHRESVGVTERLFLLASYLFLVEFEVALLLSENVNINISR
jgi:hypothetical protein